MTQAEMQKRLDERTRALEKRFTDSYGEPCCKILGQNCFRVRKDEYFKVTPLLFCKAIVLEHAESRQEADKNRFEDGDCFYIDEMTEVEMFEAMRAEIEEV